MVTVGKFNQLQVVKQVDFGVYLDGDDLDNILLPKRYVPEGCEIGDWVSVFLYFDSDDLLIATTEVPKVEVGHCEMLTSLILIMLERLWIGDYPKTC